MAAAYAALVSLSHIIQQILHPPPTHHFLIPTKQIESLQEQVCSLIDFLEKHSSQETAHLEKRIVGAAHEAEDIIESYVVNHIQAKYKIYREIKGSPVCFPSIQKEISNLIPNQKVLKLKTKAIAGVIHKIVSVREEVDGIRKRKDVGDLGPANSTAASSSRSRSVPGGMNTMIGFDEHLNHIRTALATNKSRLQIIPVVGMGGIGKTTLATHVYNDAYIVERFQFRAWVSVSVEYNLREIVVALLQQINSNLQVNKSSDGELGLALYKELFGRDYFVVLDDMWDVEAWNMLKRFLPDNGNGSRILVTTRLLNLAVGFESCMPYQVSLLSDDSSWALLLEHGLRAMYCPNELVEIGKRIARKCGGLPLALVVIGGLLAKADKTRFAWERVEKNVTSTTANDENDEQCMKILRLSYSQLPVYLKPCFLYLAIFPKNVEIRVSRLIKLWVAEGFIKPSATRSLEEVAEGYVEDLCDRNLIMVKKRGLTGKLKSCSMHDLIRDLCTREACTDEFVCIPKLDNPTISSRVKTERRLSIHSGTASETACKVLRSATLNRSFLSYSEWDSRRCIARRLNLLRILDVVDFYSMEEILRLFNSRYISCGIPRKAHLVSSLVSLLWNLQTLVVPWPVYLPSEIWNMPQLRHLKMPGINLADPLDGQGESDSIIVLENLQSLSTVNNFIFREQILERIPNLKKLGIRCNATERAGVFCLKNLGSLRKLESLVIECRGTWENMAFPSSLRKLSLSYCEIPWEDMSMVGSLPNLEVLKLQTHAAKGRMWNPNADEFSRLKLLLIDGCEMERWAADDCLFPCLEQLHLVNMKMEEIPVEFAEIPTLQTIHLNYCTRSLFTSAKRISKEREDFGYEEIQVRSFPFEAPPLSKKDVVGMEDEATKLIRDVCNYNKTGELEVISIVGMPGIGKTTLAMKIFHDRRTQYKFDVRIWVYVSQHFTRNDIFLSILNEVTSLTEEEKQSKTDTELASAVADLLRRKCFLLVMDDVWCCKDWDTLQIELPWSSKMGSKVLITSREAEVGWHVNARAGPHMLRFLTTAESYRLLRREVFGKAGYRRELGDEGSLIAERCKGLPLAILQVAGILRESFLASSEMSATKEAWKEVSDILATYDYDPLTLLEQIKLLSYNKNRFRQRPGDQSGPLHRRTGEETADEGTTSIDARFTEWDAR